MRPLIGDFVINVVIIRLYAYSTMMQRRGVIKAFHCLKRVLVLGEAAVNSVESD